MGVSLGCSERFAVRTIRQSSMTLEEGTEICNLVEQGPWSKEQKKKLGTAVSETLAGNTQANAKGKKKNQEVTNFWCFLNAEDRRVLTGDDTVVFRLTHTAQIMARLEMFWPSEQSVGHIVKTLQTCQKSGLQTPDEFHSAVVSLKKKVKCLLKGTSCGEFVAKYTRVEDLPPQIRDRFGDALGGELHGTVVLASDALRGSNKNLAIHKSNTSMMLTHAAAGQAMHMPTTMQGMMQFIGMAASMFNQQQQTPPRTNDGLPGLKIFGEQSPANQSGAQASSPQQALQLPVAAQNDAPAQATEAKQPDQQQQLPRNQDPISAQEHADRMLEAWKGNKEGHHSSDAEPKAKAKAKSKAKSQPKAKAKAKAQCMKSQPKAKAKAKAKAACKAKAKSQPKAVMKKFTRDEVRKMTLAARIKLRPHGCTKCRQKPGCTPSCFSK